MATKVGSDGTYQQDANGVFSSHPFPARSYTAGNTIIGYFKWENPSSPGISSVTDTAGNSYTVIQASYGGSGEPKAALFYATNITGHASNVVSVNFSGTSESWLRGGVTEWSGLATSSITDGASQSNYSNATGNYSTANITTTGPGLVVMVVGDYAGLSGASGTFGNPDFTIGPFVSDSFMAYLISGSAQTVSPGASATGWNQWIAIAQAFKDAAGVAAAKTLTTLGAGD